MQTIENSEDLFTCEFCYVGFSAKEILNKHRCHSRKTYFQIEGYFPCEICMLTFTSAELKKEHDIRCRTKNYVYDDVISGEAIEIKKEEGTIDNESTIHKCLNCNYQTKNKYQIIQHESVHSKEKPYKCPECDKSFTRKTNLGEHIKNVHRTKVKQYRCKECEYQTHRPSRLKEHFWVHVTDKKRYICEICNEGFNHAQSFRRHQYKHNTDKSKPFQCELCTFSSVSRSYLKEHNISKHMKEEDRVYHKCEKCGLKFLRKSDLKKHCYRHEEKKPYQCTVCNHQTCTSSSLKRHMQNKH